jgi:sec-independent protein translocase protein TatA
MGGLGAPELIIVLIVVLLLFGANKLPKLAKSLGEAQREFKKGVADVEAPAAPPVPPSTATAVPAAGEEKVTMTRAELDALLAEREAQARKDAPPSA